ncbi:hypothetical protein NDU88_004172 [Pleurodeles waltl]|uniref:Uncharacterized protein n=1 Tax=Pleurodeles waltl TaxID=8319 RepID=A0AAV7WV28_PLEWA|nr:hypothetical protein NDU88_004172 [Pleurodeles waltl]
MGTDGGLHCVRGQGLDQASSVSAATSLLPRSCRSETPGRPRLFSLNQPVASGKTNTRLVAGVSIQPPGDMPHEETPPRLVQSTSRLRHRSATPQGP